jgi:glutamate racemase
MIITRKLQLSAVLFLFASVFSIVAQVDNSYAELDKILGRESIRIVITDSGVGGLSVMSDIASKLKESGSFKSVDLIFANALFDSESGYNSLQTREEKINMFNRVLYGIDAKYDPDLIFVACNTLSVLIKSTDFAAGTDNPPVIGIVDPGIKLISDRLQENPQSSVIIFGTETTIEEGTHKNTLLGMGFDQSRIINTACPQLQNYIEQDPSGEETDLLITFYLSEALGQVADLNQPIDISLNCSHFGYSYDLWKKALEEYTTKPGHILNPNNTMGNILFTEKNRNRFSNPGILYSVVSKVKLLNAEAMIGFFESSSPSIAKAIRNYKIVEDLF